MFKIIKNWVFENQNFLMISAIIKIKTTLLNLKMKKVLKGLFVLEKLKFNLE